MLQDRTGFLWLGTQDGLNRYDGHGFRVYKHDPSDPGSLGSSWIGALAEDARGNLWVGTEGGGLARFLRDTDAFERFRHQASDPSSLSGDRVRALLVDRRGDLWIGTSSSGVNRLSAPGSAGPAAVFERFRHDPDDPASLSDDRVRSIFEDSAGHLWIGTLSGLNRLDPATGEIARFGSGPSDAGSLSDERVLSILEDRSGVLWVGTENGLNRRDGDRFVRFPSDAANSARRLREIRVLFEDDARRLWIGTDEGLALVPEPAAGFVRYRHDVSDPTSLSNDSVVAITQDRGGVLWIGTQRGADRFDPRTWAFAHYRADSESEEGLSGNAVYAFSEDAEGRLWIGSLSGLDALDRSTGRVTRYRHDPADPSSLPGDRVTALLHDREGYLWVGAIGHGLSRFEPGAGAFRPYPPDPAHRGPDVRVVTSLYEDLQGELWVGTLRSGVDRLNRARRTSARYRHDPQQPGSLSDNQVNAFAEDAAAHLWVATHNGGLNRFDRRSETFRHVRHDPARPSSLSNDTVLALYVDAAGVLWVGTQAGLNRLDSVGPVARFEHYLESDGLPNNTVFGIRSDARGRLWLSTNNGLSRFDPASESFRNYRASHGLQSNEFNFNAHYKSRSGELFFGGVGGFNAFFPDRIEPNPHVPPVVLTSFTKLSRPVRFDRPLSEVEEIALDYRDYYFSFEVAALDYAAPEMNRYRYKLEGFDGDWVDLGHRRQMTFTNLDAGRYTLRVQGSNNDGVWNEEGASVRIVVAPPPWKTVWAYALYALAAVAVVGASVHHHHRRLEHERKVARRERAQSEERRRLLEERETLIEELEAKNAELERFNYTVSHDLKSPLVTIKGFLGLLQKDAAGGDAERLQRDVRRIAAAADRMGRLLDELLQLSRVGRQVRPPEEVELSALAREALELIRGHAGERAVDVLIDPELPAVFGDRLRLLQLYQNLLGNALKYMGEQKAPLVEVGVLYGTEARDLLAAVGAEDSDVPVLYVSDNGIGIDERYHEKVFGLFERLDPASEGTGVGLALVRRIVEMHGGRIWVESEGRGRGSRFCFTLPDPRLEDIGEPAREESKVVEASGRFRKPPVGE